MASTYTTNTGIEKPGTGEQSGTWGNTTNTNFDLIDQSTNGIVEITVSSAATSGSPNSLPITNGALSNGRNFYIEFKDGGDLGGTVYYQLDPNDAEKVVHVRNNLTSQALILFQGTYNSSNDIEIPNGKDMVVKFDGGGSGATVEQVDKNLNPASVQVDNITIDGTEIDLSSGSLTLDVEDDIILDSNAANWRFKDNGTSILEIGSASSGPSFYSAVQDADMYFKGNDADGGAFTALTLDMSDQGSATFNHDVKMGDLCYLLIGAGNDLELVSDGTNGEIACANGNLTLDVSGSVIIDTGGDLVTNTSGGTSNIRFGADAGSALTSGSDNVAIGSNALDAEDAGSRSIAIGKDALGAYNTDGNSYNIAIGYQAGVALNGGTLNVIMGGFAGSALTVGEKHVAIGYSALSSEDVQDASVAIGYEAMRYNNTTDSQIPLNTAVGYQAGRGNSNINDYAGGFYNSYFGSQSGYSTSKGALNVAVGNGALFTNTVGNKSVAVGYGALSVQDPAGDHTASNVDMFNTAVGYEAGAAVTTGIKNTIIGAGAGDALVGEDHNTLVGYEAGGALTTGRLNVAVGSLALDQDTKGWSTTAIGIGAATVQDFTSGTDADNQTNNTVIGYYAGSLNQSGKRVTYVGSLAGDDVVDGNDNTAIGYNTLSADAGDHNTAVGSNAGALLTSSNNTLIGSRAGDALTIGELNTAVGDQALTTDDVGSRSVAVGYYALGAQNAPGGSANNMKMTAVGYGAGSGITTGHTSTFLGYQAGDVNVDGDSNICIGADADTAATDTSSAICIGNSITASDNDFSFGKASNVVTNDFNSDADWSRSSDVRIKKNITDQKLGLDFINNLRTVKYNYKASGELDANDADLKHLRVDSKGNNANSSDFDGNVVNQMDTTTTMYGLIAQEVKSALDTASVDDFRGWHVDGNNVQQLSLTRFIAPMIKAVQELSAKVTSLEAEVTKLKGE